MYTLCQHKLLHHHCLSQFFQSTAWPHKISGQVQSRKSIVSSPRTVKPSNPWKGHSIGHWKTTLWMVWSSAPDSQAAEAAIPDLCKREQKRPTPVQRRLSRTHAASGTTRNFVQGGSITWCTYDCSFRLFPNNWKLVWSTSENLNKFDSEEWMASSISYWLPIARCSWQFHSRMVGRGWKYGVS